MGDARILAEALAEDIDSLEAYIEQSIELESSTNKWRNTANEIRGKLAYSEGQIMQLREQATERTSLDNKAN